MPVRIAQIIDATLDDTLGSIAGTWDFNGVSPKRVSLYVAVAESGSGATVTLTVELSPDDGQTLISYDKLLTHDGNDAPQASEIYTQTEDDVLSLSPEDVLDYIKVTLTGNSVTGANYYACDVWLCYSY
ncbi:hypothetical protein LCGC14_0289210 [marine sediment metagenome]|uniref:Uncharacterized protein n=1 Tax=marine sediment metagenome TaxID=412755 RepID=A0A0F9TYS1_9ZZZZ